MVGRVWAVIGVQAVVAAGAVLAIVARSATPIEPRPVLFVVFTAALVAFTWLPPVHLEFRHQSSWITPTDGAYAIGLLALGPIGFVLAVAAAEVLSRLRTPTSLVKHAFNLVSIPAGAALGALAYTLVGGDTPLDLRTMGGVTLALIVIAAWDWITSSLVMAITSREALRAIAPAMAVTIAIPLPVSIAVGLIALVLMAWSWVALVLLLPVLALIHGSANTAVRQRAERQRVQQLAKSSAQLAQLTDRPELVATIATQTREIVAAVAAVGISIDAHGRTTGRLVDDQGTRPCDGAAADRLTAWVGQASSDGKPNRGRLLSQDLPGDAALDHGLALPAWSSALWAVHRPEDGSALFVIAYRDLLSDGGDPHRSDVLATFVAHAATAVGNASLHAEVRHALLEEQRLRQRKDEFVATVSHELRTPLTSIAGAIETLRHRGGQLSEADRVALLDLARGHTGRLRGLIEDLLLVAEGDAAGLQNRAEIVDIEALLASLEGEFTSRGQAQLRIRAALTDGPVVTDGDKLRRILAQLLDNAYKFAPDAPVELTVRQADGRIEFVVSDHGPGIASADLEQIFERFVQVDASTTRTKGGLGLGLHLCRQLTEALGGDLQVDDTPRDGASFKLSLALSNDGGPIAPAATDQSIRPKP